ncbi:MAG: hypothetical protein LIO91_06195 [Bacteroidales bacterium]|nr:hypothetical protein [Bacteroidales bacterium]
MRNFTLKDNHATPLATLRCQEGHITDEDIQNLRRIADVDLAHLELEEYPRLLIFPQCLGDHNDDLGANSIISMCGTELRTGNLMGFIGIGDTGLAIQSRFTDAGPDYFLHYMLAKVFALNVFSLRHTIDAASVFDFLIYLLPYYLTEATSQGIFKTYRRREYNDSRVKGAIDVARHLRLNLPFAGKVAYNTREHSPDNHLTQLIRHTIDYVNRHPFGQSVLNGNQEIRDAVRSIIDATPSYNSRDRQRVINANLRPVAHPYYTSYSDLQRLCLQILNHEGLKYGRRNDEVFGVLFDGAWLWEEYLNTILSHLGYRHPRNKTGEGRIFLFEHGIGQRYPDFYKPGTILDAKYKRLQGTSLDRDDLHQIIAYMHVEQAHTGGVIYPSPAETTSHKVGALRGHGGTVHRLSLHIPSASTMDGFIADIEKEEQLLIPLL